MVRASDWPLPMPKCQQFRGRILTKSMYTEKVPLLAKKDIFSVDFLVDKVLFQRSYFLLNSAPLQHSGMWRAADEAVLNKGHKISGQKKWLLKKDIFFYIVPLTTTMWCPCLATFVGGRVTQPSSCLNLYKNVENIPRLNICAFTVSMLKQLS